MVHLFINFGEGYSETVYFSLMVSKNMILSHDSRLSKTMMPSLLLARLSYK
jgi:hypothetical protein